MNELKNIPKNSHVFMQFSYSQLERKLSRYKVISIFSLSLLILLFMIVLIEQPIVIYKIADRQKLEPTITYSGWITFYQSSVLQCGNTKGIGFTGLKCDTTTCAVSQKILDYCADFGDTIVIMSGKYMGKRIINDKAKSSGKLIDCWMPINHIGDCYKSKFKIIKK
jgi:hypothetical protein